MSDDKQIREKPAKIKALSGLELVADSWFPIIARP